MNLFKKVIISSLMTSMLIACAGVITQPDWKFIQSVGGLSVNELEIKGGLYYLPVNLSVASYKAGTKSAMVCTDTSARVAGKQIFLRISTDSKKNAPNATAQCPSAKIGGIPDGHYRVMYIDADGNTHKIGDVVANLADGLL
jgi:hypothetical protein